MTMRALDDAMVRMAAARSGAVSGVTAVTRAEAMRSIDPARVTDPRWLDIPRPDPAAMPLADIARFQALVRGPDAVFPGGAAAIPEPPAGLAALNAGRSAGEERPVMPWHDGPLLPADRIVETLRLLRGVHGL